VSVGTDLVGEAIEEDDVVPRRWRGRWLRRFTSADRMAAPVIKMFAVIAVILGGLEYMDRVQAARVEQSLGEVDNWDAGGYRRLYSQVNASIWPIYSKQADFIAALPPAQQAIFYNNIGEGITGQNNEFSDENDLLVDELFYFFDRAALCADQRICDYDVLNAFIGSDLADFWRYFGSYAERRRAAGYGQYGVWTERFAKGDISRATWLGLP
tara:strand:+ start:50853 stop:51488 length:636 start_codon:yes stop_codon:yes gene_type:complete